MQEISVDLQNQHAVSTDIANHYRIIPKEVNGREITLFVDAMFAKEDILDELELLLGMNVAFEIAGTAAIDRALSLYYRKEHQQRNAKAFTPEKADFLEELLEEARSLKSSDIHFEIYEETSRIRFRIDGQLIERYKIEKESYLELVNKVKIMAKLNITEKRLPQDGRITNGSFDIRVSILPTLFGEKIVMRLLGQDASNIDLKTLGFEGAEIASYLEAIKKPNGIILISGPTGSGKTTTLYATLRELNDSKRNIVTVEDPIEYTLKGINQVQLKEDIGLSFSAALKSFLRQDPDVIMLGEIRDSETALMAIRASLTGHLVLSTIHTNSAVGTISRLIDMGIPSYLIAETLNLSVAQRLLRKLCEDCKQEVNCDPQDFPVGFEFPYDIQAHYKATGCSRCYHTGYRGRTAIYEVLPINRKTSEAIKGNRLSDISEGSANVSLKYKAFGILSRGETSLEEIYPILIHL